MSRTTYSAEFKAKLVLEVVEGAESLEAIASRNQIALFFQTCFSFVKLSIVSKRHLLKYSSMQRFMPRFTFTNQEDL